MAKKVAGLSTRMRVKLFLIAILFSALAASVPAWVGYMVQQNTVDQLATSNQQNQSWGMLTLDDYQRGYLRSNAVLSWTPPKQWTAVQDEDVTLMCSVQHGWLDVQYKCDTGTGENRLLLGALSFNLAALSGWVPFFEAGKHRITVQNLRFVIAEQLPVYADSLSLELSQQGENSNAFSFVGELSGVDVLVKDTNIQLSDTSFEGNLKYNQYPLLTGNLIVSAASVASTTAAEQDWELHNLDLKLSSVQLKNQLNVALHTGISFGDNMIGQDIIKVGNDARFTKTLRITGISVPGLKQTLEWFDTNAIADMVAAGTDNSSRGGYATTMMLIRRFESLLDEGLTINNRDVISYEDQEAFTEAELALPPGFRLDDLMVKRPHRNSRIVRARFRHQAQIPQSVFDLLSDRYPQILQANLFVKSDENYTSDLVVEAGLADVNGEYILFTDFIRKFSTVGP